MGNNLNSKEPQSFSLSKNETDTIKQTWQAILSKGLNESGMGLMTRILIEHKELRPIWRKNSLENSNEESLNPNHFFKLHGEKVFNTIKQVVNSLDDLNSVAQDLNQLGYDHYKYGTKIDHYTIFGEALLSTLDDALRENYTEPVKKAWLKLFRFIEFHMKSGMNRAENDK